MFKLSNNINNKIIKIYNLITINTHPKSPKSPDLMPNKVMIKNKPLLSLYRSNNLEPTMPYFPVYNKKPNKEPKSLSINAPAMPSMISMMLLMKNTQMTLLNN